MSHPNPQPIPKTQNAPKQTPPNKGEPGGMLPDQEPGVIPKPRKPQLSQTEVDTQRADWEGMVPEKPTNTPEE